MYEASHQTSQTSLQQQQTPIVRGSNNRLNTMFGGVRKAASAIGRLGSRQGDTSSVFRMILPTREGSRVLSSVNPATIVQSSLEAGRAELKKKKEEYNDTLQQMRYLEGESAKLSQKVEKLEQKLIGTLGDDDYVFLHAFLNEDARSITDEVFESHFGCLPGAIDIRILKLYPSFEMLLKAEKSLELTKQDIRVKEERLASLGGYIHKSEAAVEELARTDLSRGSEPKSLNTVFQQALPTLKETDELLANPTSLANLKNYPVSPMEVRTWSINDFLSYCRRRDYIDTLNQISTTLDIAVIIESMTSLSRLGTEESVEKPFELFMAYVLTAMNRSGNEKLPDSMTLYTSAVRKPAPRGLMDFMISRGLQGDESSSSLPNRQEPMIAGEFKGPGFETIDLGKAYCGCECKGVGCDSQRHKDHSVIRQLYNYMYLNGLLVGIYSNYLHTHVFIRDCAGNLLITEPVTYNQVGDIENGEISTMQLIALAILIAGDKTDMDIGTIDEMIMVPCGGEAEGPNDPRRMTLPETCRSDRDVKHETKKSKDKKDVRGYGSDCTSDGSAVDMLEAIRRGEFSDLPEGRTGPVFRFHFPQLGEEKSDNVVKVLDMFKQQHEISAFEYEADIYKQLESLQGKNIPEFIDHGIFDDHVMYGFGTKYAGESLSPEDITDDFVEEAVGALDAIHSLGVLHGDVAARNVLCNKETQRPVIIDFGMAKRKTDMSEEAFGQSADREIDELRRELETVRTKQS